uniref:probable alpha-ketoglutarate-dependent hypophosphite dioxygenase n=1 Tax=Styela clava TaxID=7725 RepID=UPI0019399133|nr:probable alpha-ketoglutarate-dependent hypophosphite dioxygenase [Styela clava]
MVRTTVNWENSLSPEEWLKTRNTSDWKTKFEEEGYMRIKDILNNEELETYRNVYDQLLSGEIDAATHRHDLGNHLDQKVKNTENICQIMWPSLFVENLLQGPYHRRAIKCAQVIFGEDMEFDFDMMISKAPHTDTIMPWHQDESYWPNLPDKRAISFWLSLDNATEDNGCMQFVPGSHKKPLRSHQPVQLGHHSLSCDANENEFVAVPIPPGSCTLHHGRTIHYTRGNSTSHPRRAMTVVVRPREMVKLERESGFDHGKSQGVGKILGVGQGHEHDKS